MSMQLIVTPNWAISGTALIAQPGVTFSVGVSPGNNSFTATPGVAFLNRYDAGIANWLHQKAGENLAATRDLFGFTPLREWFNITTATTAASWSNTRVFGYLNDNTNHPAVFGQNGTSIEGYNSFVSTPATITDGLPTGLTLVDVLQTSSGYYVMSLSASGTKLHLMPEFAGAKTDVSAYVSSTAAALRRFRGFFFNGNNMVFLACGDSGNVWGRFNQVSMNTMSKATLSALTGVNFKDITLCAINAATASGYYTVLACGDSRSLAKYSHSTGTWTELINVLPSSLSAAYAIAYNPAQASVMVGGVRTDGKGFLAYSYDGGASFTEVDPVNGHGISAAVTRLMPSAHGAYLAAVTSSNVLWGGFADEFNSWSALSTYSGFSRIDDISNVWGQILEPAYYANANSPVILRTVVGGTPSVPTVPARWSTARGRYQR